VTDPASPAISVIVPARDAAATLGRTLDCLARQDLSAPFEVIVVDDGSTDATAVIAGAHPLGPKVVETSQPGPGNARNRGAELARAPVLAFTDSDCFPVESWLARGLEAIQPLDLVQGAVDPDPTVSRGPFYRTVIETDERGLYETANLFVRREWFERIGGFEEWIVEGGEGLFGWQAPQDGRLSRPPRITVGEDTLFGWQARRLGARTGFASDALVHHAVFQRTPTEAIRYRWAWRHLPALVKRIPEMRDEAFYRRWFFDYRSASFDLAVLGVVAAAALRSPLPLLGLLPYGRWVSDQAVRWRQHGVARVAVGTIGVDAASFAALLVGSVGWRALLV
jgi:glycosyltransferase involved in cell wall biosynthesis